MFVVSRGMVCSVGLSAAAACAAMRAGIAGFDELPYSDSQGEPIIGAMVPGLGAERRRSSRLIEMLSMCLAECLDRMLAVPTRQVPLLVGIAEEGRPGGGDSLADTIIAETQAKLGLTFHAGLSRALPAGHTAALEGLRIARELLQKSEIPACIVCGVDSYINAHSLLWLDRGRRLKTSINSDGVIPGEAAAAVMVKNEPPQSGCALRVAGLGFAEEKAHVMSEDPLLGTGLAKATAQALAEASRQMHEISFRLSDVTGESYGFKEQSLTLSRVLRQGPSALPLWHCADAVGDVGSAAGACHLIRAFEAFAKGYAPGQWATVYASNVSGPRAAAVLQACGKAATAERAWRWRSFHEQQRLRQWQRHSLQSRRRQSDRFHA